MFLIKVLSPLNNGYRADLKLIFLKNAHKDSDKIIFYKLKGFDL